MESRLNIITLGVKNIKKSREFYETGLGWKVSSASQDTIVFIKLSNLILAIYPYELLAADANIEPNGSGFKGITLAQNVMSKEDVDCILRVAEKAGGKIVKPAQNVFWGGYSGYFTDPDENLWEIAWNPFFKLNEKGYLELPD